MTFCVYLVMVLLVVTKLCDVLSTLQNIRHPEGETNPIARQMMIRIGKKKSIRIVFVLALIIIAIAGAAAIVGNDNLKALFIVMGVAISIVQGAVAHNNWSGHENLITRRVRVLHEGLLKFLRR